MKRIARRRASSLLRRRRLRARQAVRARAPRQADDDLPARPARRRARQPHARGARRRGGRLRLGRRRLRVQLRSAARSRSSSRPPPTPARADDSFVAKTQIYTDSDHTTVVSPLAALSRDAWKGGTLSASYVADVVSSASIDVVSNATTHMNDFRSEITAGLVQKLRNTTLSGAYVYSVENDYQSHNVELGVVAGHVREELDAGASARPSPATTSAAPAIKRSIASSPSAASRPRGRRCSTAPPSRSSRTRSRTATATGRARTASCASRRRTCRPSSSRCPRPSPTSASATPSSSGSTATCSPTRRSRATTASTPTTGASTSHTVQLRYFITWKDVTLRLRERFYYQTRRQLLPAALHGGDAAAVRDRRSRARRRSGPTSPASRSRGACRGCTARSSSRPRSTTSTSATSTSRCSLRATAPTSRRGSMSSISSMRCRSSLVVGCCGDARATPPRAR